MYVSKQTFLHLSSEVVKLFRCREEPAKRTTGTFEPVKTHDSFEQKKDPAFRRGFLVLVLAKDCEQCGEYGEHSAFLRCLTTPRCAVHALRSSNDCAVRQHPLHHLAFPFPQHPLCLWDKYCTFLHFCQVEPQRRKTRVARARAFRFLLFSNHIVACHLARSVATSSSFFLARGQDSTSGHGSMYAYHIANSFAAAHSVMGVSRPERNCSIASALPH